MASYGRPGPLADGATALIVSVASLVGVVSALLPSVRAASEVAREVSVYAVPVAVVLAVTRCQLFDRIISRTLAYAVLTGLLTGTYLAVVAGEAAGRR